jgi:hypothetical protein
LSYGPLSYQLLKRVDFDSGDKEKWELAQEQEGKAWANGKFINDLVGPHALT